MILEQSAADQERLNKAAGMLDAVGRASDEPTVAIYSLLAVELLVDAGAVPDTATPVDDAAAAIRKALRTLAPLTTAMPNEGSLHEALDAVQRAYSAAREQ